MSISAFADEGQWPPDQLSALDQSALADRGLTLDPDELWGDERSLLRAVVNYSGCSASFISSEGLIATNHHCAYSAIRALSSVQKNYLQDGFLAKTRAEEQLATGRNTITIPIEIEDVTKNVLAEARKHADDLKRYRAVDQKKRALTQACEKERPHQRCEVRAYFGGGEFKLHKALELTDVRLVYAPPSSIGAFGGDVDNWMWPRHAGDFSLLRAYVGPDGQPAAPSPKNVPFRPTRWLPLSTEGVKEGDFVAVLGYPGHTDRYLHAVEIERRVKQVFPKTIELYGLWIDALLAAGDQDPAAKIKVAGQLASLQNRHKNSRGMLAGIKRMNLIERRRQAEVKMGPSAASLLNAMAELSDAKKKAFDSSFVLTNLSRGPNLLANAIDLVRRAQNIDVPQLKRPSRYTERNAKRLWRSLAQRRSRYVRGADIAMMRSVLERLGKPTTAEAAGALLDKTPVQDAEKLRAMFDQPKTVLSSEDPLILLAKSLVPRLVTDETERKRRAGAAMLLIPQYIEQLHGDALKYPDANGSLRVSFASVQGYAPRDGLYATPFTSVAGQVNKHTGEAPFDLPASVRDRAPQAPRTAWSASMLGDVPVCFLSNADTTGGNSGSAVINGEGALVGLNFDRVWENIAGDFGYTTARSRNIAADVRYLLWTLDQVEDAGPLLLELGVADRRGLVAQRAPPPATLKPPRPSSAHGRSCQSAPGLVWWVVLLGVPWFLRRLRETHNPQSGPPRT